MFSLFQTSLIDQRLKVTISGKKKIEEQLKELSEKTQTEKIKLKIQKKQELLKELNTTINELKGMKLIDSIGQKKQQYYLTM